jgi:hypothetical protein
MNKDRTSLDYSELVEIQTKDLARWKVIARPAIYAEVEAYVRKANLPAQTSEDRHRVYRGHEISTIFFQWPNLAIYFVSPSALDGEDLI